MKSVYATSSKKTHWPNTCWTLIEILINYYGWYNCDCLEKNISTELVFCFVCCFVFLMCNCFFFFYQLRQRVKDGMLFFIIILLKMGMQKGSCLSIVASLLLFVAVTLRVRRPERKVISEQLHYERRVFIGIFVKCIQFGDGIIERLFR